MFLGIGIGARSLRATASAVINLFPDGGFDDPAEWATAGSNKPTVSGSALNFNSTGSGDVCADNNALTTGLTYRVTFTVESYTSGNMRIRFGTSSSQVDVTVNGPGTYQTDPIEATGTALSFISRGGSVMAISSAVLVEA